MSEYNVINLQSEFKIKNAHYPASSLSKGTKQTFHLFFPTSYVSELKK